MRTDTPCSRTACTNRNAVCIHRDTKRPYCPSCARRINEACSVERPEGVVEFPLPVFLLRSEWDHLLEVAACGAEIVQTTGGNPRKDWKDAIDKVKAALPPEEKVHEVREG